VPHSHNSSLINKSNFKWTIEYAYNSRRLQKQLITFCSSGVLRLYTHVSLDTSLRLFCSQETRRFQSFYVSLSMSLASNLARPSVYTALVIHDYITLNFLTIFSTCVQIFNEQTEKKQSYKLNFIFVNRESRLILLFLQNQETRRNICVCGDVLTL
jgi:hypothetical protein